MNLGVHGSENCRSENASESVPIYSTSAAELVGGGGVADFSSTP